VNLWADTSALMRSYLARVGAQDMDNQQAAATQIAVARITRAEVVSALQAGVRNHEITNAQAAQALADHDSRQDLITLPIRQVTVDLAVDLLIRHPLKAYDAIQLAAAMEWKDHLAAEVTFATFDERLSAAAEVEGFTVWPSKDELQEYKERQEQLEAQKRAQKLAAKQQRVMRRTPSGFPPPASPTSGE
jgi:predicted nucleic acid-binding protein